MQQVLKVSTAATTIVGPVLDSAGAVYTGLLIAELNITKNGVTAAMAAAASLTHDHNGHYLLVFTTGNTDTPGRLDVTCNKSTYAMPPRVFEVLPATVFDALVTNATNTAGGLVAATAAVSAAAGFIGSSGAAVNGTTANTLAGHDPGATLASTTNITAGTISTVTNLTNAPTAGDLTAAMKTSIGAAVAASAVASVTAPVTVGTNNDKTGYSLTQAFPANFSALGITAGGKVSGVVLVDTLTTYTNNTPQTGDSFARIGAAGAGLTSLAPASTALSTAAWTSTRAGYLDNLSGGAVALASGVTVTTNSDKAGYGLTAAYDAAKTAAQAGDAMGLTTATGNALVAATAGAVTTDHGAGSYVRNTEPVDVSTGVAAIKLKTDNLPADPADASDVAAGLAGLQTHGDSAWATATGFSTAGDIPTTGQIAAALLAAGDVDGFTLEEVLRVCLAALSGKLSGAASTTITIRAADDSKTRITATVDESGNRSAVTIDATG